MWHLIKKGFKIQKQWYIFYPMALWNICDENVWENLKNQTTSNGWFNTITIKYCTTFCEKKKKIFYYIHKVSLVWIYYYIWLKLTLSDT